MPEPDALDPAALGRMLMLQNILHAAPDDRRVAELFAAGVARMPGVLSAAIRHESEPLACSVALTGNLDLCRQKPDGNCAGVCPVDGAALTLPLPGRSGNMGELLIRLSDASEFSPYHPLIENTASLVGLLVDRHQQEQALRALNRGLEEQVRLRTAALQAELIERSRSEEALRQSEARLRHLVDGAPDGIFIQTDFRFVYVNAAATALYGARSPAELVGTSVLDRFDPSIHDLIRQRLHKLVRTRQRAPIIDQTHLRLDGTRFTVEVSAVPWEFNGRQGALVFLRDTTARRQAEEQRRALEGQIQQAQKLESLGVLAGGIAHDFNNLLTAILGNIDLALGSLSPASPARQDLTEAETAARRAAELVRQMLAYSGRGQFVIQTLRLREVIEEMTHMLQVSISKKAVMRFNFADSLPAIQVDATQLRQVIMNLVINASEAIGERSGVIAISTGAMTCDTAYLASTWLSEPLPEGLYVYVEVADTGCGIEKEKLPRIFDPFFTTKFTGRGLGLAAVLGIVRGHRGAIKVYSEPGRGTSFKVLLPASAQPSGQASLAEQPPAAWQGSGLALLVDDEESIRALASRMLELIGFEVVCAPDGQAAMEIFRARAHEITCVILDLTMPHMDGEETFRELRRVRPDVRVVISSGYDEQDVIPRFSGKGLAGFVQKPFTLKNLRDVLEKVLQPGA